MPKYYYWCPKCNKGYATRAQLEEDVFPFELGPKVTCDPCGKIHPPEVMERLGRWPEGLRKMQLKQIKEQADVENQS